MSAFADQLETDLANVFLNTDEFGVAAVFQPVGCEARTINVIFDDPFQNGNPMEVGGDNAQPTALCQSSDVEEDITKDAKLTIAGVERFVVDVRPDGLGATLLILSRSRVRPVTADSTEYSADDDTLLVDQS